MRCNNKNVYILHTECFYAFVLISAQTAVIDLYNIELTGFYNRDGIHLRRNTNTIFKHS